MPDDVRVHYARRTVVANQYVEIGAYMTAAKVLRDLSFDLEKAGREKYNLPDNFNPFGSGPVPIEERKP